MFILRATLFRKFFPVVVFVALTMFSMPSFAQTNYEDVVYLKNGSIIHGIIIEQVPNESIKIQTADRNIFVFKMDEVLKITKEEIQPAVGHISTIETNKKEERKKSGYINITEWSFARSFDETQSYHNYNGEKIPFESHFDKINNSTSFGLQNIFGYMFNPYFSMGAGIGFQGNQNLYLFPMYVDVRANFIDAILSPFTSVELGYSFASSEFFSPHDYEDRGGIMGLIAIGAKYFALPKMALNLSVGFRYQEISHSPGYSNKPLNQFNVKTGLAF
jgi:hypothetical protein